MYLISGHLIKEALWTLYDDTDLLLGNEKFTFVIQPFFIGVDVPRVCVCVNVYATVEATVDRVFLPIVYSR